MKLPPITLLTLTFFVVTITGNECPVNTFDCGNGVCVSRIWVCDEDNDCGNLKDEEDCDNPKKHTKCLSSQFQCEDYECIPAKWYCDGEPDCVDTSDEKNCKNSTCEGFRCKDNHCIPQRWRCDGQKDCKDASDEILCPKSLGKPCTIEEFACDGLCLDLSKVCDGKKDCSDSSDEGFRCSDTCNRLACGHKCKSTPSGFRCFCEPGYQLQNDNKTCSDIDECEVDGFCSQKCKNLPGSYECSCLSGYIAKNRTCSAIGNEPLLVFVTEKEIRARHLHSGIYYRIHESVNKATAVDVDPRESKAYWAEVSREGSRIYSINLDGSGFKTIISHGLQIAEGIALDYIARNIYLTDSGLKQVLVCKMDGSICHILHKTNVDKPRALAIDVIEGLLYWSDWGETPGIYRSGMDGTRRTSLVSTDIKWPNGMTIDHTTERLYWCDAQLYRIEYITLDGLKRKIVLEEETVYHPYSLTVFEDTLYWTDWATSSVDSCNKFTGHKQKGVAKVNGRHIMGIHVYHPVLSKETTNTCWASICSHMCVISPFGKHRCVCPPGFNILEDQVTCLMDGKSPQIFVTAKSDIFHIQPEAVGNNVVTRLPINEIELIGSLVYNWKEKVFYISDLRQRMIIQVNTSTLVKRELVKEHVGNVGSMAYDWLADNLYWTDSAKGTVEVLSLKTMARTVVISNLTAPMDLVLAPEKGLMFIAVENSPRVAMYEMDGSSGKTLATVTGLPKFLALHPKDPELFWCDPRTETIASVNYFNPSKTRKIYKHHLRHVSSIAASANFIYWLQSSDDKLHMMHMAKNRSITSSLLIEGLTPESDKKVIYVDAPDRGGTSACVYENGGCSHICLVKSSGHKCSCPVGLKLVNANLCSVEECNGNEFKCAKNGKCIPLDYRCDHTPDCDDSSDEENCEPSLRCPDGDFQCRNGKCIVSSWKCDSRNDCGDNSDEENCPKELTCPKDKFYCANDQCVPTLWRCDGESDCADDEKNCDENKCKDGQFRCNHGQCIPVSWVCDGSPDCLDSSDERREECKTSCQKGEFRCDSGICIDHQLVCDHRSDCDDNSDEKNCVYNSTCKEGMFHCDDGACIYNHEVCDGYPDCSNDEFTNCTRKECSETEFYCASIKRCIPRMWLCDGDNDCTNGADESLDMCSQKYGSSTTKSPGCNQFLCTSGDCVPWGKVCNGQPDCFDHSDEGKQCATSCGQTNGGCSHLCSPSPHGPRCSCIAGYKLLPDEKTCDDENECLVPEVCSQYCNNTKGGFKCSCAEGYFLGHDHRSCKADGGSATLVYLLPDQIRGLELSSHSQHVYFTEEYTDMRGVDFDAADGVFYWSEWKEGTISRYNIGSRRNDILVRGLQRPYYIKWDWIAKNIYYTNGEGSIKACSKNGDFCTTVVESAALHINSFEISPEYGVLFWSVWSDVRKKSTGLIERADMDGRGRIGILSEKIYWPSSLAIDNVLGTIYWADVKLNVVELADFHGLNRRVVVTDGMYYPFSMTMFEDFIYWADWGTDSIIRCNKFTGTDCLQVHKNNVKAETILVVHKVKQPRGINRCLNSRCSQICLPNSNGFSCHCDSRFQMENFTCIYKTTTKVYRASTSAQVEQCDIYYCENGGECYIVSNRRRCRCPHNYEGTHCNVKVGGPETYDYSWVAALLLGIGAIAAIILIILICRQNRNKISKLTDTVAVSFRNPGYNFRKKGGLVMDTDDAGVDELMLGKKGAYKTSAFGNPLFNQRPYLDPSPEDGDYKRWPSYDSDDSAFVSEHQNRDDTSIFNMDQPSMTSKERIVQFFKKI